MITARLRDEDGSILPLICFYSALALLVTLLVASATSLYLERKRLFTLADGAALVGAESFDLSDVSVTPHGPRVELQPAQIRLAVRSYLVDLKVKAQIDIGAFAAAPEPMLPERVEIWLPGR